MVNVLQLHPTCLDIYHWTKQGFLISTNKSLCSTFLGNISGVSNLDKFPRATSLVSCKEIFEGSNVEAANSDTVVFACFNPISKWKLLYSDMQKLTERNFFFFFLIFMIMILLINKKDIYILSKKEKKALKDLRNNRGIIVTKRDSKTQKRSGHYW